MYVWEAGTYFLTFHIFHLEPAQVAVFKNDNVVTGSVSGDQVAQTNLSYSMLIEIFEADFVSPTELSPFGLAAKLNIRNHTSYAPFVTLDGHLGTGSQVDESNINVVLVLLRPYLPLA